MAWLLRNHTHASTNCVGERHIYKYMYCLISPNSRFRYVLLLLKSKFSDYQGKLIFHPLRISETALHVVTYSLHCKMFQINENEVEVPSSVINHGFFYYYSIFESFTCFGLIGPSSEGALETTNVPRSTSHNRPNSPCFALVHVGIGYIN
jgi:hypothetical protein